MPTASIAESRDETTWRILVADDDPILCELMQAKLSGSRTRVECAQDGSTAWDMLRQGRYDLAIIDLKMPQLDGFHLIRNLRQSAGTMDLPIIVATSRNDDEAIERSFSAGATTFVTKPVNWALLRHQVRFAIRSGETERALRRARASADLANRTKDNLFQLLSHELRTPLNVLVGFADVLQADLKKKLKGEQVEHLSNMTEAAQHLNAIVGDVLKYSRLFAISQLTATEPVAVSEIISDCTLTIKGKANKRGIRIVCETPLEPVLVNCDNRQLLDALHRLLDNAVKFSSDRSVIEIAAVHTPDKHLDINIRDSGAGISASRLQECLQPFFQADMSTTRNAEGLGLGLAIAKRICELHGGELLIDSSVNRGTVATIRLPAERIQGFQPRKIA